MKKGTKDLLTKFIEGIPPMSRKLGVDFFSNPNDQERLIKVAISLLDNKDSIEIDDIRLICEEVGQEYLEIIENTNFHDNFALPIYSKLDEIKNVIELYEIIK